MIVTLIKKENISTITLPDRISGQVWLTDLDEEGNRYDLISIEGINNQWIFKSNKMARLMDSNNAFLKNVIIKPLSFYNLVINGYSHKTFVFTEPVTEDRQLFKKLMIRGENEITIGRSDNNDIMFNNRFVSSNHANLTFFKSKWSISDLGSTNGTFVNGHRINTRLLFPGDTVYIMGFKIIIGNSFIAFNNPDEQVIVKSVKFVPFVMQTKDVAEDEDEDIEPQPSDYFYRSPRFKRDIEKTLFKVDSPPSSGTGEEMPVMLTLGPAMTMGMASLATGAFAVNNALTTGNLNGAIPSVVMSSSMLLGTVLWPILAKKFEKKRKKKKENTRQLKYKEYLYKVQEKFAEESLKQAEILHENHVPVSECAERIQNVQRNLWERGLGQNDFLKLRVGLGNVPLSAEISYSERRFSVDNDNLQEDMYSLCETPKVLQDVPITLSLFDNYICGVIGERTITIEFAKGLMFQLASLYSYDEVKLVYIYDLDEESDFRFVKWLPHVWNNENTFRFVGTNNNEIKEVSAYLEKEIESRSEINENEMTEVSPYYIIFAMSKKLAIRAEMLKQLYAKNKNIHISVVTFYDELKNLPKECTTVVELEGSAGKIFDKNDISGKFTSFIPDIFVQSDTSDLSIRLANVPLDTLANSYRLPSMLTFLEMFGVGKVEHLNALTRWKENDPTKTLEAAVGVDTLGELFKLDLHEKFHGPHGLVAGMTGSGKSEFIITYILSLAVNYHPNEVAFILIDYKGGGMAKAFESLPHTAGIITNLDGAAVKRSLISIESELKRRQSIFGEASKKVGVSNIDIYKYQKLYREGTVSEPLQHLFIISDEFAELKTQQPEFMAQLVSAARIGRSLGVHLILATQKPAGVVDDQIWSNSKFRVCLKVQERADSMDMLKRPDAAELSQTGRFYLQVGYNELFEMGQSAWAGAPYYPSDKVVVEKDNSVSVIDRIGRVSKQVKIDSKKSIRTSNPQKQLDAITDYLGKIAREENIKIRTLWLDPIPEKIYISELREKYHVGRDAKFVLNPIIGEYDDPAKQRQCVLRLPISQDGNVIVYGAAGNGKTTFITTMVYSIMQDHTPEEVNIYILDFASETLTAFAKAPHVGDVVLSYESEKVNNLFKSLYTEIEKRKKLFSRFGGDYSSYISESGETLPSIIVIINNFAAFQELFEEKIDAVSYLSREGIKYGLYFVLTASGTGAVRFRMLQNFKQLFVLQLNDESDYSSIVGKTEGLVPSKYKGRGLVKLDSLYEFQIAYISDDVTPFSFIREHCNKYSPVSKGIAAKKIPILPEEVNQEFIADYVKEPTSLVLPIGVEKNSLEVHYYSFINAYIHMILSAGSEHMNFAFEVCRLFSEKYDVSLTLFDIPESCLQTQKGRISYCSQLKDCENSINQLFDLVVYRNNSVKDSAEKQIESEKFYPVVVVFNSLNDLKNVLPDLVKEKLSLILEKGEPRYNVTIIIADSIKNVTSYSFEKWYKKHITQKDGIWVGPGIAEQYHLKTTKMTAEMHDDITADFGFAIENGKSTKIKLLNSGKEE